MGYCHCSSCRSWSAGPVNAFTLWKPENVKVTKGAQFIGRFKKTETSDRQFCTKCGGHLMTDHPTFGLTDVYAATIPTVAFTPGVHVNYAETVLRDEGRPAQAEGLPGRARRLRPGRARIAAAPEAGRSGRSPIPAMGWTAPTPSPKLPGFVLPGPPILKTRSGSYPHRRARARRQCSRRAGRRDKQRPPRFPRGVPSARHRLGPSREPHRARYLPANPSPRPQPAGLFFWLRLAALALTTGDTRPIWGFS